jgi:hypothetical protein
MNASWPLNYDLSKNILQLQWRSTLSECLKSDICQQFAAAINDLRDQMIHELKPFIRLFKRKTQACEH